MRWQPILGVLAMATLSGSALAEDAAAPNEQTAAKTADGIRKDAKGVTGISPFWEALQAGDRAFVARSYTVALQSTKRRSRPRPISPSPTSAPVKQRSLQATRTRRRPLGRRAYATRTSPR